VDPDVLAAIELALQKSPADTSLRSHLVKLLLEDGQVETAAAQAHTLLYYEPDHEQGLALAAAAAQALGDVERSDRYKRILDALYNAPKPALAYSTVDELAPSTNSELDAFLQDVLADAPTAKRITLDDIGGLEHVKTQLRTSFLGPLKNPEFTKAYNVSLRGGLLLWGPPGCGKTFLARALAGELNAQFLTVALHDVLDMWLGNSEKNVHSLFEQARRLAPCVLFFDEIDAIGMKRTQMSHSAGRGVITQLLNELDGVNSSNDGIFVLGATNAPWDVDSALRRPGRFDRTTLVLPPDEPARLAILQYQTRDLPLEPNLNFANIAHDTELFSGADLALLCKSAAELAMTRAALHNAMSPLTADDFAEALRRIPPSTKAWFSVASNYATFANRDGEYDELQKFIKKYKL
jgi:SpoVK/Ycf46/Vps4 family AAA+-type ATPase